MTGFNYFNGAFHVTTDILLALLPIPIVKKLQTNNRRKSESEHATQTDEQDLLKEDSWPNHRLRHWYPNNLRIDRKTGHDSDRPKIKRLPMVCPHLDISSTFRHHNLILPMLRLGTGRPPNSPPALKLTCLSYAPRSLQCDPYSKSTSAAPVSRIGAPTNMSSKIDTQKEAARDRP